MKRCFLGDLDYHTRSFDPDYYDWKYGKNVYGKPVVWVAEDQDRIVGLMCAVPRMLWMNGKAVLCAETGDTFVDADYRGKNIFMQIAQQVYAECERLGIRIFCGVPNPVSLPIMTRLFDYRVLFDYRSMIRPLNFASILQKKIYSRIASGFLGAPASALYGLFTCRTRGGRVSVVKVNPSDHRLDAVWERNKNGYQYCFQKDRAYIDWRFGQNPEAFDVYLFQDDEPLGYAVIKISEIKGFTFASIADWMIPADRPDLFVSCMQALMRSLKAQGMDFIADWAILGKPELAMYKRMGFFARKKPYCFILRDSHGLLSGYENLNNGQTWTFSQADSDNI